MIRHIGMKMTVVKKQVCDTGGTAPHAGPHGKNQGWSESRTRGRKTWARIFTVVSLGWNRQSKVGRLRIGYFKSFSGLWDIRAVPACLVPGSGVIRWTVVSSVKAHRGCGWDAPGFVGLYLKDEL